MTRWWISTALVLFFAGFASADSTVYTDFDAWKTAVANEGLFWSMENLEMESLGLFPDNGNKDLTTFHGIHLSADRTWTNQGGTPGIKDPTASGSPVAGAFGNRAARFYSDNDDGVSVDFGMPVYGWGAWLLDPNGRGDNTVQEFYGSTGLDSHGLLPLGAGPGRGNNGFFGVVYTNGQGPFDNLFFDASGAESWGMDNIVWATEGAPEPGILALVSCGLILFLRRRR